MARLFLINPPTDETVRSPLLSFMYLAASLRRAGHEVALLDASAEFAPHGHDEIVLRALAFEPDLVGIHCKTLYAQDAYALAGAFRAAEKKIKKFFFRSSAEDPTRRSRRWNPSTTASTSPPAARARRPWSNSATPSTASARCPESAPSPGTAA